MFRIHGIEPEAGPISVSQARELVHRDDRERFARALFRLSPQDPEATIEVRVLRADGEMRYARVHLRAFFREDSAAGSLARVVGTLQDVTDQALAVREIERLNAELEARVQERTAELRATNAELESFTYAVSHDLRTPLRAVAGFSRALIEDYGPTLDSEAQHFLDLIMKASATMSELIDALLSLSRFTRSDLRSDDLDLSRMSAAVIAELEREQPARSVKVSIEPAMEARGDARMIRILLHNLLGNAWKYSSKVADPEIRVFQERAGGACVFCVADNGAGFSMEYAGKLFQPFQRLHRQDEFPGTGIGLATVQRIVQRHGGAVTAEGRPGAGATFRFTLPLIHAGS
jgi:light-regulated signal transduction histidine kinase (bacteriophytochrome)